MLPARLLINPAHSQIGRGVVGIVVGGLLVPAERSGIIFPAKVEIADLHRLAGRGRYVMVGTLEFTVFLCHVLSRQRDRPAEESHDAKQNRRKNGAHTQIVYRDWMGVNCGSSENSSCKNLGVANRSSVVPSALQPTPTPPSISIIRKRKSDSPLIVQTRYVWPVDSCRLRRKPDAAQQFCISGITAQVVKNRIAFGVHEQPKTLGAQLVEQFKSQVEFVEDGTEIDSPPD